MRKNNFFLFLLIIVSNFLFNCGKNSGVKRKSLSVDYYKMSLLELEGEHVGVASYRRALQFVNRALEQRVVSRYVAHKATLLFLLGAHDESLSFFRKALSLSKSASVRSEILNNYACLLASGGDKKGALKLFIQLEHDKHYLTPEVAVVNQARLYCDEGEWGRARGKLVYATKLAPNYVDAFYYLGLVCYALKEYDAALCSIERTVSLEPAHRGAKELLSRLKRRAIQ
ncbi:tetratricopeptide repeat protein [Candidatus Dependentiae bacterium]|nr:tetratricopeptide repeat protein [Candidatus Dependentiae bacterium]